MTLNNDRRIVLLPTLMGNYPSAGSGTDLLSEDYYEVHRYYYTPAAKKADYVVPVKGDSMEPKYMDGDLVLVRKQPVVGNGEVGIFLLDGQAYIKQLKSGTLHSFNKDYEDIEIDGELFCFGKVLGLAQPVED